MAYIGQEPVNTFSPVPTKDSFTGDGSTTTFDLNNVVVPGGENALEVFVNNVRQEPGSGKAFTLGVDGSNDLKRITFTAAPASGAAIYVVNDKTSSVSIISPSDLNGVELVLDADGDTSLTADTDDRIDIKIAGSDHFSFSGSSGDTVIKPLTDAKDIIFQQYDGNKVLEINDGGFVGVGGNSNAAGELRIYEDTDNGSHYVGFKAGNNTESVSYVLPTADGTSGYQLTTDGSGTLTWAASTLALANDGNNRIATGTGSGGLNAEANATFDGSTLAITGAITASTDLTVGDDLSLDSDAAVLNFGDDQDVNLTHVADTGLLLNAAMVIQFRDSGLTIGSNADGDLDIVSDGTAVDSINIESAGGITLDAGTAGNGIVYEDDGTEMLRVHNSSSDVILESKVSDKDIIFKVNDGGSSTEVARFDGDVSALKLASGKQLQLGAAEENISGDGTDITFAVGSSGDINIPANIGLTFGDDGEKIEGDGTDLTIAGNNINLTAVADVNIPSGVGLTFATGEKLESDGTDLTITVGSGGDINIGTDIGLTFGNDGEKIEGDGTDLTISGNNINLTATADVNIPSGVGITFATAEKIESDGTDLSITVGSNGDINIPANIGLTFGDDGEKIEGDGTDLTIAGNNINLTATADVVIPANVGITFGTGEKIEGDSTDLTITSGAKINLTATSDVHIPNNVGIVFGGDSEKIEGDGTDMTISANNLTIDAAADITLDADGADIKFADGGTNLLGFANSSSDVVIKPLVDAKDIIFHQYDGTSILEINDGGYALFTAAALNAEIALSDGSTVSWNSLTQPVAKVTLGGNRTLANASGGVAGQFISLLIIQDGTGSRTLTWNAAYEFASDTAPTLTTTAAKGDLFVFRYNGSKWLEVGRNLALTLS